MGNSFKINSIEVIPTNPTPDNPVSLVFDITTYSGADILSSNVSILGSEIKAELCMFIYPTSVVKFIIDTILIGILPNAEYNLTAMVLSHHSAPLCENYTDSAWIDTTFSVFYGNGMAEFAEENEFLLFPNPVQETINLSAFEEIIDIVIYSLDGQIVWNQTESVDQDLIDVSFLSSGNYIVKVTTKAAVYSSRVLKD